MREYSKSLYADISLNPYTVRYMLQWNLYNNILTKKWMISREIILYSDVTEVFLSLFPT